MDSAGTLSVEPSFMPASSAAAPTDEGKVFIEIFGLPAPKLVKLAPTVKFGRLLKQIGRPGRLFINGNQELAETDTPAAFGLPLGSSNLTRILFEEASALPPVPKAAPLAVSAAGKGPASRSGEPLMPSRVDSYQPLPSRPATPPNDRRRSPPVGRSPSDRFLVGARPAGAAASLAGPAVPRRATTFVNTRGGSTPTRSPREGSAAAAVVEHETQTSRNATPYRQTGAAADGSSRFGAANLSSASAGQFLVDTRTPMQRAVEAQFQPNANAMRHTVVSALDASPQLPPTSASAVSRASPSTNLSGPGRGVQRRAVPSNHAHGDTVVPHVPWPSEVSVAREGAAGKPGLQGSRSGSSLPLYFNKELQQSTTFSGAATPAPATQGNPKLSSHAAADTKVLPTTSMTPSTQLSRLNEVSPIANKSRDDYPAIQGHHGGTVVAAAPQQVVHGLPAATADTAAADGAAVGGAAAAELLKQQQQLNAVIGTLLAEIQNLRRDAEDERRQRIATEQQLTNVMQMLQVQMAAAEPPLAAAATPAPTPTPLAPARSASAASAIQGHAPPSADDGVLEEHLKLMQELRGQRRAMAPRGAF